jgi:hypothetical protein
METELAVQQLVVLRSVVGWGAAKNSALKKLRSPQKRGKPMVDRILTLILITAVYVPLLLVTIISINQH